MDPALKRELDSFEHSRTVVGGTVDVCLSSTIVCPLLGGRLTTTNSLGKVVAHLIKCPSLPSRVGLFLTCSVPHLDICKAKDHSFSISLTNIEFRDFNIFSSVNVEGHTKLRYLSLPDKIWFLSVVSSINQHTISRQGLGIFPHTQAPSSFVGVSKMLSLMSGCYGNPGMISDMSESDLLEHSCLNVPSFAVQKRCSDLLHDHDCEEKHPSLWDKLNHQIGKVMESSHSFMTLVTDKLHPQSLCKDQIGHLPQIGCAMVLKNSVVYSGHEGDILSTAPADPPASPVSSVSLPAPNASHGSILANILENPSTSQNTMALDQDSGHTSSSSKRPAPSPLRQVRKRRTANTSPMARLRVRIASASPAARPATRSQSVILFRPRRNYPMIHDKYPLVVLPRLNISPKQNQN